ncbi:unnamed protein product [Rotaria magnacalcarata]|uniref:Uncharacterized protein n=2 Tax=Rotaria magnacalcarata TaxID=392030 RepID=A0A819ISJ8_9BILA|nr:unnamed protein product [Rotaria magnacalcarata]
MDEQRYLYVSGYVKHEVRRYQLGEKNGTLVAGGNEPGDEINQLSYPTYLFVDRQQNVYVSDTRNHRVMRWTQGDKKQGTVIVSGNEEGEEANQFWNPIGLSFDRHGNLYVVDCYNYRVQRFSIK